MLCVLDLTELKVSIEFNLCRGNMLITATLFSVQPEAKTQLIYFLWLLCLSTELFFFLTGCCVHVVPRLPSFSFRKYLCHNETASHLVLHPA